MSANNAGNRFPRGEAVSFLFAVCSIIIIFQKCSCELKNETDEECGRKCLLIANNGTSTCVLHRSRYRIYTKMKCVSRIPHPPLRGTFPPGEGLRPILQIAFFDMLQKLSKYSFSGSHMQDLAVRCCEANARLRGRKCSENIRFYVIRPILSTSPSRHSPCHLPLSKGRLFPLTTD